METMIIALASLALLSTAALAGEKTVTTHTGGDKLVTIHACFPSTGNWVNAATQSCPDRGSGGLGITRTYTVRDCDPKEAKRS